MDTKLFASWSSDTAKVVLLLMGRCRASTLRHLMTHGWKATELQKCTPKQQDLGMSVALWNSTMPPVFTEPPLLKVSAKLVWKALRSSLLSYLVPHHFFDQCYYLVMTWAISKTQAPHEDLWWEKTYLKQLQFRFPNDALCCPESQINCPSSSRSSLDKVHI